LDIHGAQASDFGFWILDFGLEAGTLPAAVYSNNPKSKIQNPKSKI